MLMNRKEGITLKVGEVRKIFIGSICVDATVKKIQTYGQGNSRCLMVTYEVPGYGETQPFMYIDGKMDAVYGYDPGTRIARSLMPSEYHDKTAVDFDWSLYGEDVSMQKNTVNAFITRYEEFERAGRGLYIFSRAKGSGKTYLACILANEVMKRRPFPVKFMNAADLIAIIKSHDEEDKAVLDGLYQCRLLILDDIGAQDSGQAWINEGIFRLIDYRYREKRPVIFTSNCDTSNLTCDERIADRIDAMSVPVKMPEKRIRKQKAMKETGEFLKSIMNGRST